MRLNEINSALYISLDTLKNKIDEECTEIMRLYRNHPGFYFYRGVRGTMRSQPFFKGDSKKNRIPRDVPIVTQQVIVKMMQMLGFGAHRGNSIFVTSNSYTAGAYGIRFVIFPRDGFQFIWSRVIVDLFNKLREINYMIPDFDNIRQSDLIHFEDAFQYTDKNLSEALTSKHEVMISGSYYAINSKNFMEIREGWL